MAGKSDDALIQFDVSETGTAGDYVSPAKPKPKRTRPLSSSSNPTGSSNKSGVAGAAQLRSTSSHHSHPDKASSGADSSKSASKTTTSQMASEIRIGSRSTTTSSDPSSSSRSQTPSGSAMLRTSTEKTEDGVTVKASAIRTTQIEDPSYRSFISPRSTTIITRSATTPLPSGSRCTNVHGGGVSYQRTVEYSSGLAPSSYTTLASADASAVKSEREKEKKDMQDLNERLANYIEKVRFLEAQNRKLANELELLKDRWGKDSSRIKDMYDSELKEARDLIDRTEKEKASLEIRLHSLEDEVNDLKRRLEEMTRMRNQDRETCIQQQQQLSDYEAEMALMKRRLAMLEDDRERDRKEISRLQQEIIKLKFDLDAETLNHIDAENRRQTLEEELEFMRNVHEQEMKDLAALAYRDSTPENREYWRNELAQAIRDIQCEYDNRMSAMKAEYETYYNMKISEVRTANTKTGLEGAQLKEDIKKLRSQITELRGRESDMDARNMLLEKELDMLKRDFDERERDWDKERVELLTKQRELQQTLDELTRQFADLNDKKLSLELEICAYRRLLEGEEKRLPSLMTLARSYRDSLPNGGASVPTSHSATFVSSGSKPLGHGFSTDSLLTIHTGIANNVLTAAGTKKTSHHSGSTSSPIHHHRRTNSNQSGGGVLKTSGSSERLAATGRCSTADIGSLRNCTGGATSGFGMSSSPSPRSVCYSSAGDRHHLLHHNYAIGNQINQVVKGEMSAKTTYQRSAKGPITIGEVSAEGKFISLENTGKKDEVIDNWQIRRNVDNRKELAYQLPRLTIQPGKQKAIKVWVRGHSPNGSCDVQSDIDSWGVGSNVFTALYNDRGEERATHTQKTVYTS